MQQAGPVRLYGKRGCSPLTPFAITCNEATSHSSGSSCTTTSRPTGSLGSRAWMMRGRRSASSPTAPTWSDRPYARSPRSSAGSAIRRGPNMIWRSMAPVPRAERLRLRRFGRPEDGADRAFRRGRPSRHQSQDRKLSRFSRRDQRRGPRRARPRASRKVTSISARG